MPSHDRPKSPPLGAPSDPTSRIEPAKLEAPTPEIIDAIAELTAAAAVLGSALHPKTAQNLAELVRIMNTYYSNLIEGHETRPRDIERALAGKLDREEGRRNLQLEATAHLRVQAKIDALAAARDLPEPASEDFLRWIHREFYRDAPAAMLALPGASPALTFTPGAFRSRPEHDNVVGRHLPPSSERVAEFMRYFAERYQFEGLGLAQKLTTLAAAHHRFNYIHPFADGNGRVSRLMSHAMCLTAGIGAHGLWSVSRGLARGLAHQSEYKQMMDLADSPREGDLDGRGNLSQRALAAFVLWFLRVCLDQVRFMGTLFDLATLSDRLRAHVESSDRPPAEAGALLDQALLRGDFERGEASRITGLPERSARRALNATLTEGLLGSETPKGPVSLRFPPSTLETLFPKLYPAL